MSYLQAIVIGLLQGITELFPVSRQSADESFYLAFGDYDVVAVCEFPDNASAAAFSLAAASGGSVKAFKTTPLLTPNEGIDAMKKAGGSGYKPPK